MGQVRPKSWRRMPACSLDYEEQDRLRATREGLKLGLIVLIFILAAYFGP